MLEPKRYKTTTIDIEERWMNKLDDAAQRFGVTKIQVIRTCIENELPRLIDRESKRKKRQTQR